MLKPVRLLIVSLLGIFIVSCGQGTPEVLPTLIPTKIPPTIAPTATRPPVEQTTFQITNQQPTNLRVVNAVLDSPPLTIYAGFRAIATNFSYAQYTETTSIDAGEYTIKILPSGSASDDAPLLEQQLTFEAAQSLILVLSGQGDDLSLTVIPQQLSAQEPGETTITAINASADGSPVAVRKDGIEIITPVGRGKATRSAPQQTGGTLLTVQLGNTSADLVLELQERQAYMMVVAGSVDKGASVIQFSTPVPGLVEVRAVHAAQRVNGIDVYVNDNLLNGNVEFGKAIPWQPLLTGNYTVSIFRAGDDPESTQPLVNQNMTFDGSSGFSLIVMGGEDDLRLMLYAEDLSPTAPDEARLAFLNTLPDVPRITLLTGSGTLPDIRNINYGEVPKATSVVSQTITFRISGTSTTGENRSSTVEQSEELQLQAGTSYLYLITGQSDNQPVILSREVGTREGTAKPDNEVQSSAARVRFINATTTGAAIDFSVNNSSASSALPYAQASEFSEVAAESATISVSANGTSLSEPIDMTFEHDSRYTIVAYNTGPETIRLLIIPDTGIIANSQIPHLRLINVSSEAGTEFALAYSESPEETEAAGIPAIAPKAPDLRRSIPFGMFRIMSDVDSGNASNAILMPEGRFDVSIVDSELLQIGATISGISLTGNSHYDIVAYEETGTQRIQAFAVLYPD